MNKQYQELFQLVARNGALNAENAMSALAKDKENDHTKEFQVLTETQDMFNNLENRLLNNEQINEKDYILLYAGATVSRNIIQKNIDTWSAVVREYDENLIPKLTEVVKETDETKRMTLIEDFFS